jgi:hypothetical protein
MRFSSIKLQLHHQSNILVNIMADLGNHKGHSNLSSDRISNSEGQPALISKPLVTVIEETPQLRA